MLDQFLNTQLESGDVDGIAAGAADMAAEAPTEVLDLSITGLLIDSWPITIPLIIMSGIAIAIWIERYLTISKAGKIDNNFMNSIKNSVSKGDIDGAKDLCLKSTNPVATMIHKGISRLGNPLQDIRTAIENAGQVEISKMEKNLSILATISGAAPMIGFLGTVIGMMDTFHQMTTVDQISIPDLAGGIMYAMTTTVVGLIVGIIAYLGYNLLVSKVDKVVHSMEDNSLEFMDLLNDPAS